MKIKGRPLRDIVNDLERLNKECEQWYRDNVELRMLACTTRDGLKKLVAELTISCDDNGRFRDIPRSIGLPVLARLSGPMKAQP